MAVTSLWRVKGYIGKLILYASNPDKTKDNKTVETGNDDTDPEKALGDIISYASRDNATEKMQYVYGLNCGVNSAKEDMMTVKKSFNKTGGVVAYHGYQSFAEGEVDPKEAFEIGKELADELWGDEFQVLVTTHLDKESHIHNHFVINTVSMKDGHKFHRTVCDSKRRYHLRAMKVPETLDILGKLFGKLSKEVKQDAVQLTSMQTELNSAKGHLKNVGRLLIGRNVKEADPEKADKGIISKFGKLLNKIGNGFGSFSQKAMDKADKIRVNNIKESVKNTLDDLKSIKKDPVKSEKPLER